MLCDDIIEMPSTLSRVVFCGTSRAGKSSTRRSFQKKKFKEKHESPPGMKLSQVTCTATNRCGSWDWKKKCFRKTMTFNQFYMLRGIFLITHSKNYLGHSTAPTTLQGKTVVKSPIQVCWMEHILRWLAIQSPYPQVSLPWLNKFTTIHTSSRTC